MKKIVIAMLLLLPLIIVASVLLATSVIAHEVYIAVEAVELNVDSSSTIELGLSERTFQLKATVYPTGARNKDVVWSVDNVQCFGDEIDEPVTIKDGNIEFSTYCTFDAVVTTVEGNKSARCNFYVKCDELNGIDFEMPSTMDTGDKVCLAPTYAPRDAEVKGLTYISSAPTVAEVDHNGVLRAKNTGTAEVTVFVTDKPEIRATKTLTVNAGATRYGTSFYLSANTFSLSSIGAAGATVTSGGTIDGDNVTFTSDTVVLNVSGTTVTVKKCNYDDIVVKDKDYIESKDWYIGRLPLYLEAEYLDATRTDAPELNFSCSDPSAVDINGKEVTFVKKGLLTFSSGDVTVNVNVVKPVAYIRLNTVNNDDLRGIANETVYGTKRYLNGEETEYEIPISIQYPKDADWSDFDLTVDDTDLAEIRGRSIFIKGSAPAKKVLNVSVTAHYSSFVSMEARANRHFHILDGVNCYDYSDVVKAATSGKNVILRSDLKPSATDAKITLNSSLFGNAYMIDYTDVPKEAEEPIIRIARDNVTVSNVTIRGGDAVLINTANGLHGAAIWAGDKKSDDFIRNVRIEYSILENAYYAVATSRAEVTIDGCIMRNISNFGVFIPNDYDYSVTPGRLIRSDVVVHNCIMSNIVAPAIGISTFKTVADTQSTFRQTGFLDVYNWQDLTSSSMLDREYIPDNAAVNQTFSTIIKKGLVEELKKDDYKEIRYTIGDIDYIHLGGITSGALNECTTVPEFEDARFHAFVLTEAGAFKTGVIKNYVKYPIVLYGYENTADITPETQFLADKAAFAKLRGE